MWYGEDVALSGDIDDLSSGFGRIVGMESLVALEGGGFDGVEFVVEHVPGADEIVERGGGVDVGVDIDVIPCDEEEVFGASELVLLRGDLGDELLDLVDEKFLLCACIVWGFEAGQDLCGLVGGERQGALHRENMPVEF